jgi:hypothetical protein
MLIRSSSVESRGIAGKLAAKSGKHQAERRTRATSEAWAITAR